MTLDLTTGLQLLLDSDAAYTKRYAELVQEINTSPFATCKKRYLGEFGSWRNRKGWAKSNGVEWDPALASFKGFLLACGPKPVEEATLDRIDHTGPYLLANLRWGTKAVQNNNKGNSVRVLVAGEYLTLAEIAQRTGRSYDAVRMGVRRHGPDWAATLVADANPAIAAEFAWEFPVDQRDELEAEYAECPHKGQSRLRFFIHFAKRELAAYSWKESMAKCSKNYNRASYYRQVQQVIADLRIDAIHHLKVCWRHPSVFIFERDGGYV
jgi:hypothetical protein